MSLFNVPTKSEVSPTNQGIFDSLESKLGMIPNLYAVIAHSENALQNVMQTSGFTHSINNKEQQIVNLAVSQVNNCNYCLAAHTAMGKGAGLTDDQILEVRAGKSSISDKLNALAAFSINLTENRGHADAAVTQALLDAGYTKENVIDIILVAGLKTISNYVHSTTEVPVDFPAALELENA